MCNSVKLSVNRVWTSGEKLTLSRPPPYLPPTTIYNLAIRQLIPVHDKRELPVPQLQFSLCGGSPLLSEHRGNTGSSQNSGYLTLPSATATVHPCTLTIHAQRLKRPKLLVGIDPPVAVSLRLIELCCIEAHHTYTNRFLIRPLIKHQLC